MFDLGKQKELEDRLHILELQNTQLAEQVEDNLMLGMVSEAIEHASSSGESLEIALELISMIKNIPVVLCCVVEGTQTTVLQSYLSFQHGDLNKHKFILPYNVEQIIQPVFLSEFNLQAEECLNGTTVYNQALLIPFSTMDIPQGMYIFVTESADDTLSVSVSALQRVTNILSKAVENHDLLLRYKELNEDLDARVTKRSQELVESEGRYRALVENSNAAIMVLYQDFFIDCNPATLRMFHIESKEDFCLLRPENLSSETQMDGSNSAKAAREHILRAQEEGSDQFEWMHRRSTGEDFLAVVQLTCIEVNHKHLVQAMVTDMSSLMHVKEALRISESNYRNIIENMQDCFYRTDVAGHLIFASPSIQTLMACQPDEILGDKLSDYLVEPKLRKTLLVQLLASEDGKVESFEIQVRRKDGKVIWLSASAQFIYRDGKVCGVEGTLRDITKVKQHEKDLSVFSQAVDQAGESIMITDAESNIEYVNPAFVNMTGYSHEDAVEKSPWILKSPNQTDQFYEEVWENLLEGKSWEGKLIEQKKDGMTYPALVSMAPIFDDEGSVTHCVTILRDMTELQEMEKRFHQAQKMEALGTLAGGVAHDFNNILAAIVGSAYLAKKHLNAKGNEDLLRIEQQSKRAAEIVEKLLMFARKDTYTLETLSLSHLISSSLQLFRISTTERIEFVVEMDAEQVICVEGDSTQLQQVILNLINNARDALEGERDPKIRLGLSEHEPDKDFDKRYPDMTGKRLAHIFIDDNGQGILNDNLAHIFEPFFTSKAVGKGSGLGLAMVHGTIERHEGVVDVESREGEGTCFHIYLPISDNIPEVQSAEPLVAAEGGGESVLIVDDEEVLLDVHREVLSDLGYKVWVAHDGVEAIKVFKQNQQQIKIIIMDVVMPKMGGVESAQAIRQLSDCIPIIFATGYDKSHILGQMNESMSNFKTIGKPFNIDELTHMIRGMLATN